MKHEALRSIKMTEQLLQELHWGRVFYRSDYNATHCGIIMQKFRKPSMLLNRG